MQTLNELRQFCLETIKDYPHLESEILDFFQLAEMEINDGESEQNEVHLAYNDIKQLITNR